MYHVSERYAGHSLLRLGTVDDFNLVDGRPRPTVEVYVKGRCSWVRGVERKTVLTFEGLHR